MTLRVLMMLLAGLLLGVAAKPVLAQDSDVRKEADKAIEDARKAAEQAKKAVDEARKQADKAKKETEEERKKALEDTRIDKERFALYTKKGRNWTLKKTVGNVVEFTKYTVEEVEEEKAIYTEQKLDGEKQPVGKLRRHTQSFRVAAPKDDKAGKKDGKNAPEGVPAVPKVEETTETVNVEAGEFECVKQSVKVGKLDVTTWLHKKYRDLIVKQADTYGTLELVEFNE